MTRCCVSGWSECCRCHVLCSCGKTQSSSLISLCVTEGATSQPRSEGQRSQPHPRTEQCVQGKGLCPKMGQAPTCVGRGGRQGPGHMGHAGCGEGLWLDSCEVGSNKEQVRDLSRE